MTLMQAITDQNARVSVIGQGFAVTEFDVDPTKIAHITARHSCLDPHVPQIPPMREYHQYTAREAIAPGDVEPGRIVVVLIATDHKAMDYSALLTLGCPVVDARNAIARRSLPMGNVVKV